MRAIALTLGLAMLAGAVDVPRKATEIGITLPDGSALDIGNYHGKVVCLAFILTT